MTLVHLCCSDVCFGKCFLCIYKNRVNKEGTLYTGALIGLGHDPDGNAVYPADDIEASFDIHLTQEDLVLVSKQIIYLSYGVLDKVT